MSNYLERMVERTENLGLVFQYMQFICLLSIMLNYYVWGKVDDEFEGALVASTTDQVDIYKRVSVMVVWFD